MISDCRFDCETCADHDSNIDSSLQLLLLFLNVQEEPDIISHSSAGCAAAVNEANPLTEASLPWSFQEEPDIISDSSPFGAYVMPTSPMAASQQGECSLNHALLILIGCCDYARLSPPPVPQLSRVSAQHSLPAPTPPTQSCLVCPLPNPPLQSARRAR